MHGPEWLANPTFSIILVVAGFFFLYLSLRTKKEHRLHQHSDEHSGIEIQVMEKRIIDTNRGWILFTLS
ncbi:MAG: hypothetical protein M3M87_03030, partial [Thermoproteota archaeon]|nr:hypothetical protein [Thermoproteota archaeon]